MNATYHCSSIFFLYRSIVTLLSTLDGKLGSITLLSTVDGTMMLMNILTLLSTVDGMLGSIVILLSTVDSLLEVL